MNLNDVKTFILYVIYLAGFHLPNIIEAPLEYRVTGISFGIDNAA